MSFTDSGCSLPLEIIDLIMRELAAEEDVLSLNRCTRVCLNFAAICQQYLFHTISLSDSTTLSRQFRAVLDQNPRLAKHVRSVNYSNKLNCRSTVPVLHRLHSVHTFMLKFKDYGDDSQQNWDTMLPALRTSLCNFFQSNSIVDFSVRGIENVPLGIFFHFPHLKILTLSNVSVSDAGPAPVNFRKPKSNIHLISLNIRGCLPEVQKLLDATYEGSGRLLNLRNLEDFSVTVNSYGMPAIRSILSFSECLASIHVHGFDIEWLGNLARNLTTGSLQTLKRIQMNMVIELEDDPYKHLIQELNLISGRNVLEEVDLIINVETDGRCRTDMESWSQLDVVLSAKDAFPFLRYVGLLLITNSYSCDYTQLHERLDEIAENGFPRLQSRGSEVEFSCKVEANEVI
ncbi:hypothetical protein BJ912DRAFT_1060675 [Pholiota molesta]|nr:hypothetical protein BJ912DRAFT_1060675 [Pholiota molesta]